MTDDYDDFDDSLDAIQDEAGGSNRTLKIIGILVLLLVFLCICVVVFIFLLPVLATAIFALLGPTIGEIFSDIVIEI